MRKLLSVVLAAVVAALPACGGNPPPNPTPTPTPGPTPPPSGAKVKIVGNKFEPRIHMPIPCCSGNGAIDIGRGWPGSAKEWIDAFHLGGWNAIHVRLGPFSDQGYGWDLIDRIEEAVAYATSLNMISEVDLTDHWPMKHVTPNLYNDSCEVTQGVPPSNYQWFVRIAVQRLAKYNVIFNLGNEGFDCSPSVTVAWEDAIYSVAKTAMRDAGLEDRPVGSTFKLGKIGDKGRKVYDYATVHGFGFQPALPDKPVFLTESDNQPHGYDAWTALLQQYKDADMSYGLWRGPEPDDVWYRLIGASYATAPQQTASVCLFNEWKAWVGYEARPDIYPPESWFERIYAAEAAVIARRPDLFPAGSWCLAENTYRNRIDVASEIQRELQPGCTIVGSTDCPTCNPFWDMDSFDPQLSKGDLAASPPQDYPLPIFPAPQTGVYCGQHYIHHGNGCFIPVRNAFRACGLYTVEEPVPPGPMPSPGPSPGPTPTPPPSGASCGALGGDRCNQGGEACPATHDAIASSDCDPCCKRKTGPTPPTQSCGAMGGDRCEQSGACPDGWNNLGPSTDCKACCDAVPFPTPTPTPTPTPPVGDACPLVSSQVDSWQMKCKGSTTNLQVDCTPIACGPQVVAALDPNHAGKCLSNCCYLSPEKGPDNGACSTKLYGNPDWSVPAGANLQLVPVFPPSTFTMKVNGGSDPVPVTVKGIDARADIVLRLRSAVPACVPDAVDPGICKGSTNKGSEVNP